MFGAIPLVATLVVIRQSYLNTYYHLSTWKGGGMGMFAGADGSHTRTARIYIEDSKGTRQPIVTLLTEQNALRQKAMWYPTRSNFAKLARSLRHTAFVASHKPSPVYRYDDEGTPTEIAGRSHYLLRANGPRAGGDTADWDLVIEYWETAYNPETRKATISLVNTMRFEKGFDQ